jgi:ppGpp synthetase/RelA/SpoT-type nucleotidyltranferase
VDLKKAIEAEDILEVDSVSVRVKRPKSFLKKVAEKGHKYTEPLAEIEDQVAARVMVVFKHDVQPACDLVLREFRVSEKSFHHPEPIDAFGYETEHMILVIPEWMKKSLPDWFSHELMPTTFEMQVRTLAQHAWAEPQHNFGYKSFDDLSEEQKRILAALAANAWSMDLEMHRLWLDLSPRAPKHKSASETT